MLLVSKIRIIFDLRFCKQHPILNLATFERVVPSCSLIFARAVPTLFMFLLKPFLSYFIGVPLLEFSQESIKNSFQAIAGSGIEHEILTFGYPSPNVTLRRKIGDSYATVEASKVTLDTERFVMNCVDLSDSGDYQIVAANTHGSYRLNFTLTVIGLWQPFVLICCAFCRVYLAK